MSARIVLLPLAAAGFMIASSPAIAEPLMTYHCRDGGDLVASMYPGGRRLSAKVDGRNLVLTRRFSLSGRRYVSGDVVIRIRGQTATLSRGRRTTDCTTD
jgi:membrane-bound inhibitor of C-type lysozyme